MQANASGFLRYVSLNGVTGVGQADNAVVDAALGAIREQSDLLICVGLGVRTPEQAAAFARTANGVVVGLALVEAMFNGGEAAALELTRGLAGGDAVLSLGMPLRWPRWGQSLILNLNLPPNSLCLSTQPIMIS